MVWLKEVLAKVTRHHLQRLSFTKKIMGLVANGCVTWSVCYKVVEQFVLCQLRYIFDGVMGSWEDGNKRAKWIWSRVQDNSRVRNHKIFISISRLESVLKECAVALIWH